MFILCVGTGWGETQESTERAKSSSCKTCERREEEAGWAGTPGLEEQGNGRAPHGSPPKGSKQAGPVRPNLGTSKTGG